MKNFYPNFFRFLTVLFITNCFVSVTQAQVTGVVFRDFNGNGTRQNTPGTFVEPLVAGVTVRAYNSTNVQVGPTKTTDAVGAYSFTSVEIPLGTAVRIEFTGLGLGDYNSFNGTGNSTNIQFVTSGAGVTANYALNAPDDYWNNTVETNPVLAVVQNHRGRNDGVYAGRVSLLQLNNSTQSTSPPANSASVTIDTGQTTAARRANTYGQTGSAFGLALQQKSQRTFTTAVLKRGHGFGPQGPGGIYISTKGATYLTYSGSFTLQGVTPSNGGGALDFGTVTRRLAVNPASPTAAELADNNYLSGRFSFQNPPSNANSDSRDMDAFAKVGTMSYGDIEADKATDKLYTINLFQRRLIVLDVENTPTATLNGASAATLSPLVRAYNMTTLPGWPTVTGAGNVLRPYGIKIYKGVGYIGVVSDASSTQVEADVDGYVLSFNPNNIAAGFTTVLTIDFNQYGQLFGFQNFHMGPWVSTWAQAITRTGAGAPGPTYYAQPMIAGFEFNEDGSMDIAIRDRWGDQGCSFEYIPVAASTTAAQTVTMGDLLHATKNGAGWLLESNATQPAANTNGSAATNSFGEGSSFGSTGKEYYADRSGDGQPENNEAGITKLMGTERIVTTVVDPMSQGGTVGSIYWSTQGVQWNNTTNGNKTQWARTIGDASADKSNGMGDLEFLITPQPIQIGNRIWNDTNGNGIQDAGEAGINGVAVELVSPGPDGIFGNGDDVVVATTSTATVDGQAGSYFFSTLTTQDARKPATWTGVTNILPGFDYQVRVANASGGSQQAALAGLQLTRNDAAANSVDNIDNDAVANGTNALVTFNTNNTNHNFDIGFKPLASIGDKVWRDDDKDGIQDAGEPGVAGVTVTLYQNGSDGNPGTADDVVVGTTVTDAYGNYLFDNLTPTSSAPTRYNVGFTLPANYQFTTQTNTQAANGNTTNTTGGATAADGSDANISTGRTGSWDLSAGENERGADAGIIFNTPVATNSIGNKVWFDTDGDGDQDANEPGVSGVTVTLYAADGVTIVATTVTDASGNYLFTGLPANTNYIVGITPPVGTILTTSGGTTTGNDTDSDINPTTRKTTVINTGVAGTSTLTIDAGLIAQPTTNASLGDRVWYDNNRNGVQDPGEPGIAGVTVQLLAADGVTVLATTVTDALGNYIFPNLAPGDYRVGFGAVAGMQRTTQNSTSGVIPDATDSDADITTGITTGYRLVAGEKNMSVDCGYYSTQPAGNVGALGDKVWNDLNGDGIQDANEPGVAGITVTLYNSAGTAIANTVTDANGNYLFPNLTPGDYSVGFSNLPTGYGFTGMDKGGNDANDSDANPATGRTALATVTGGITTTTLDAGIRQGNNSGLGSLGDRVWYDLNNNGLQDAGELGAAGVTVNLYTDANNDGVISGAELTPTKTTTTNALGEYIFDGLNAGNYQVGFTLPTALSTYTLSAINQGSSDAVDSDGNPKNTSIAGNTAGAQTSYTALISLAQGEDNLTVDLGIVPPAGTFTLGGTAWFDTDSDGLQTGNPARVPGVLVTLYNNLGIAIGTTTTDENGDYLFVGLVAGDYSVGFSNYPTGYDITLREGTNTAAGGSDADRVSGRTSIVTIGAGNPNDRSLDAGLVSPRAALGNYVWDDADRDGIQDAGETPVAGVTVSLYFDADNNGTISGAEATTPVATAITDANGKYFFPNLTPGNYQVGFTTLPTGMEFTTQDNTTGPDGDGVNTNGVGGDSDVNPSTGRTAITNLTAGEVDLTVDAGIRVTLPATIGNKVWADLDTDGVQDANEPGIGGVLVTLYNSSNQPIGSALTDGNGNWQITNVPSGTGYYVIFTSNLPGFDVSGVPGTNPAWTAQNIGTNGTQALDSGTESDTDSDVTPSGVNAGRTGTFNIVPGNNFPNIDAGIINWPANNILPIQLVSFTAQPQNGVVQLGWVVATETNVNTYEVEYSTNGINYSSIGSKVATGSRNYSLVHNTPKQGLNYYRLKIIDKDGKVSYSEVRKVNFGVIAGDVKVYPNPATSYVNVTVTNGMINQAATIKLIAADGKVVYQQTTTALSQTETINVNKLASGKYFVQITTNKEVVNKQVQVIR